MPPVWVSLRLLPDVLLRGQRLQCEIPLPVGLFFFFAAASARTVTAAISFLAHLVPPGVEEGQPTDAGQAMATPVTLLPAVIAGVVDRTGFPMPNLFFGAGGGDAPVGSWKGLENPFCPWQRSWAVMVACGDPAAGSIAPGGGRNGGDGAILLGRAGDKYI